MIDKIDEVLASVGLGKNERKVYFDVVKNEKSTALDIAKRTSIHRTNVYDALHTLAQKGFVAEKVDANRKWFIACDPQKIKDYLDQLSKDVDFIIPYLRKSKNISSDGESVTMSKGIFSLRDALASLLELGAPIDIYGASREALDAFGVGFLDDFHKRRISKKIPMRHIYHQDMPERIAQLNKMKYTFARYLPRKYDSSVSTSICGDTVLLIIFTTPTSLITIKNKTIADSYSKYFEILWQNSTF